MRAAIVKEKCAIPVIGQFDSPVAGYGEVINNVSATKGLAMFENALMPVIAEGVDVVLDYLWGDSALAIMSALVKANTDRATRFVSIGTSSGEENIPLPSAILRSSTIEQVGIGDKSVSKADMLSAVRDVFEMAAEGKLKMNTIEFALEDIEKLGMHKSISWKPRGWFILIQQARILEFACPN